MALPATRDELKEYCLRKLGKPVINIDVSDTQIEDRIDEALTYYADYHFDGSRKVYSKHTLTSTDISNEYITINENIIGITKIFDIGGLGASSIGNIFNINYQFALSDMHLLSTESILPYWMSIDKIQNVSDMLTGKQPIRFNRHTDKLYIDTDWGRFNEGDIIILDAYEKLDPEVYTDVYADRWLLRYCTALIKRQWGNNLKKFDGMQLPGGITFSGREIYDEADTEIATLEGEMISSFSLPVFDMIG